MNSYVEYCKVFTKCLKTSINNHKMKCSAKEFDSMITGFVSELYGIKLSVEHPFATEQDAYNFAYCIIFTITSTSVFTIDEFKRTIGDIGTRLPEQFIQDMYAHIMERKHNTKPAPTQVVNSSNKMPQPVNGYEAAKARAEAVNKADDSANSYCSVM